MAENAFTVITSRINISWKGPVFFSPTKGTGCQKYLVPWMLKSPLTSILNRLEGRMSHGIGTSFKDAYSHIHHKELIMGPGGLQLNFL